LLHTSHTDIYMHPQFLNPTYAPVTHLLPYFLWYCVMWLGSAGILVLQLFRDHNISVSTGHWQTQNSAWTSITPSCPVSLSGY